ncbi:MlaC/ttg2D family ABC transporter substrate-binding protein [Verticiella alkaliphila]|uniref:MlaC/ttg2D family ABC transporter substrate-binding protein n=1 Tax=Verticiella alkaliphila TaxID=2779529 RepID=UPI00209B672F|nr:ABC transporter substrate-binding protein [Verticiella sp. GG226]
MMFMLSSQPWKALRRGALAAVTGLSLLAAAGAVQAQAKPDPNGAPDAFVKAVAEDVLNVLKQDKALQEGNVRRINQVVDERVLPYVDFEKTTRLAVGRNWRDASPQQREQLVQGFRGTLVRTYSGAFRQVSPQTSIVMLPFRGDAKADDVVVNTQVRQPGSQPAAVDYRLERTSQGWRVYDISVEGIWLIQNYRNQFAQQIQQNGIDGLIATLNQRNQ